MSIISRVKHAWNAFMSREPPSNSLVSDYIELGPGYSRRPDRPKFTKGKERSIINSIYNRIAIDCSSVSISHARLDDDGRYLTDIVSGLNNCLTLEANKDQTSRAFIQDVVMSMFDEGCVAIVPVDTSVNPVKNGSYDILSLRTARITQWYPDYVEVHIYNDREGKFEDIKVPKKTTAIVENPLYSIMNEPNSTLQRLIRKLNLLDAIDEQSGASKLDLIIQLPYIIKSEQRKAQAEKRRKEIEEQLANSKYGIAYTDGTEKVTQINRPVENNLMSQIEYLTKLLYSQLGITETILDGTADEKTMLNYNNRTIEPVISAIVDEMKRKFLTKTARSQGQSIVFFRDYFRLAPVSQIADIADKFTRNEIMTSNEVRQIVGYKPSSDPEADSLRNKNITKPDQQEMPYDSENPSDELPMEEFQNG